MTKKQRGAPRADKYKKIYRNLENGKNTKVITPENVKNFAQCVRSHIRKYQYNAIVQVFNGDVYVSFTDK